MISEVHSYYAIIVAGGKGKRMNHDLPKQFIPIAGLPIMMHTIKAFSENKYKPNIIVVLNDDQIDYWKNLVRAYDFKIPHDTCAGGKERFHSVKNGLDKITDENAIIAIHDAVRPLIDQATISECFANAAAHGNAIAAIISKDSVRLQNGDQNNAIDRNKVYLIQTPQTFRYEQIKKAYRTDYNNGFTDDASVVEQFGYPINLISANNYNLKITYQEDLEIADYFLCKKKSEAKN